MKNGQLCVVVPVHMMFAELVEPNGLTGNTVACFSLGHFFLKKLHSSR